MTEARSWTFPQLPEQHLMPDAVVAFVDGELSAAARDRAASHIARCPLCARDTAIQRQARAAVRTAEVPSMSSGLLAALRNIPTDTDLPTGPDQLAMTEDGQLVAIQRPDRVDRAGRAAALGSRTTVLGSGQPLGTGDSVLSTGRSWHGRRAVQGAGVVAAGLMLGALAMVGPHFLDSPGEQTPEPAAGPETQQASLVAPLGGAVRAAVVDSPVSTLRVRPAFAPRDR